MKNNYIPKEIFKTRMQELLGSYDDTEKFFNFAKTKPRKSIRINTLKISTDELIKRIESFGWKIKKFDKYPEIIRIESELMPGELGKTKEHILGYYYVQEITSMMPIIALSPEPSEMILDLCASPGSKTTQAASMMKNTGTIFANDLSMSRVAILSANLERCGVTNTIVTRHDATEFASKINSLRNNDPIFKDFYFDKVLVDAPCSGEGNIRVSPRTLLEWSIGLIHSLSKKQKKIAQEGLDQLKVGGIMVYSTCTHSPEENELVVQHLLDNNDLEIIDFKIPIISRPGLSKWNNITFHKNMHYAKRIYHHDNDMEGFFLCKLRKLSDKKNE